MFSSESSGASYNFFGSFCMILHIQPTEWPKWPVLKTEEPCFLKWGSSRASWQSQTNPLTSKQFVSSKLERNLARREKPWKTKLVDMKNKFHFSSLFFSPTVSFFPPFFPASLIFLNNVVEHIPRLVRQLSAGFPCVCSHVLFHPC